jgi:hypothetical protein
MLLETSRQAEYASRSSSDCQLTEIEKFSHHSISVHDRHHMLNGSSTVLFIHSSYTEIEYICSMYSDYGYFDSSQASLIDGYL